ncbi:MAG: RNA polymerase sigma factor [Spirochaetota bacterium]
MGSGLEKDERLLVERARAGDREAFGLIVHRYVERVYRVAYSVVRNAEDASDVAQDTFVRAYRGIDRFDTSRPIFPWLYQIARNLGINRLERTRKRETSLPDFDTLVASDGDPEAAAVATDEAARIRAAVAQLSAQHRLVIELNHFQECSYKEMAEILDVPIGTVMSRLYNARRKLKEILHEEMSHVTSRS